jgi:kynureninase
MDVRHVADAVLYMANLPLGRQCAVHDRDGDQDAVCGARMSVDYRDRFHIPKGPDGVDRAYLCGHSLGLQPKSLRAYLEQELKDWELLGVEGHFRARHPWVQYNNLVAEQTARLVGAQPIEVVAMNSLTVNLHLMMVSFYRPTGRRRRIVIERTRVSFRPICRKVASPVSWIRSRRVTPYGGRRGRVSGPSGTGGRVGRAGPDGWHQLLFRPRVRYGACDRAGHAQGCMVGFDLAHAAGNLVLKLHEWDADFAAWCTYKYLNAGPGSIAGCFVHERHAQRKSAAVCRLVGP